MRDRCVASGNKYFQTGRYKEASILYRRALQLDPKYGEAYYRLGLVQAMLQQYAEAARSFERATSLDPANEDAGARLAQLYVAAYASNPQTNKRLLGEARSLISQMLKRNPKSYDGLRLDADLATIANDPETALRRLREADQVKPWQPEVILALMQNLAVAGRQPEAQKLGEDFIARKPPVAGVYDLLFLMYRQDSQFDRAEATLKKKIANLPADATSRLELAAFYYTRNQRSKMSAQLEGLRSDRKTFAHTDSLIGDFYLRIGEFDAAMQAYQEGLKNEPKLASSYQKRIADVLLVQGKNQQAMEIVAKLHKDDPRDIEAAAIHASLLAKSNPKQVETAIGELEALVAKEPGNATLQLHLGHTYWAKGDSGSLDKARQHFETCLKIAPDALPAKIALAQVQLARGESGVAVQISDDILKSAPANLQAKLTRATGLINIGSPGKAREELMSILGLYPNSNDARFQLASLDLMEKRYSEAEAGFQALAASGDGRGVAGLADTKEAQGQAGAAAKLLEQELAKQPDRDGYRLALAEVLSRMGRLQEARTQLETLARKNPDASAVQTRLGTVQKQLGDSAGALQSYRKAHQSQPADLNAALGYALLLDDAGEKEQARLAYEEVLKIDSENSTALNNLAYIQADQGVELDRALGMAQRALQRSPKNPNISDTLGLIYIRKKLSSQAVQVLQEVVARVPDNPSFRLHLGMALYDAGQRQLAKKELEKALQYKPSAAEQAKIRELVARIG
jgi:tetratricopeptide (TPR) repeat protein